MLSPPVVTGWIKEENTGMADANCTKSGNTIRTDALQLGWDPYGGSCFSWFDGILNQIVHELHETAV